MSSLSTDTDGRKHAEFGALKGDRKIAKEAVKEQHGPALQYAAGEKGPRSRAERGEQRSSRGWGAWPGTHGTQILARKRVFSPDPLSEPCAMIAQ